MFLVCVFIKKIHVLICSFIYLKYLEMFASLSSVPLKFVVSINTIVLNSNSLSILSFQRIKHSSSYAFQFSRIGILVGMHTCCSVT